MNKIEKIEKVNELASMVFPLFEKVDQAYNSSMDLLSVNFLEKSYLNLGTEDLQDVHNQWAEDNSELSHYLKSFRKFIKHMDILPEDSFVSKVIRNNIKWNVSQVWEIITENFSMITSDLIEVGKEKWEIDFSDIKPEKFLERIEFINDDELETHIFRTFAETNATKGEDTAIHLVTDWWIETNNEPFFLSGNKDIENKISAKELDSKLIELGKKNNPDSFIQIDAFSFTYTLKLAVLSDVVRLISIYMGEYWNDKTVEIIFDAIDKNEDIKLSLLDETWEESLSIISKNLQTSENDKGQNYSTSNNEFYKKLLEKIDQMRKVK